MYIHVICEACSFTMPTTRYCLHEAEDREGKDRERERETDSGLRDKSRETKTERPRQRARANERAREGGREGGRVSGSGRRRRRGKKHAESNQPKTLRSLAHRPFYLDCALRFSSLLSFPCLH